jgi:hypothetical protein
LVKIDSGLTGGRQVSRRFLRKCIYHGENVAITEEGEAEMAKIIKSRPRRPVKAQEPVNRPAPKPSNCS